MRIGIIGWYGHQNAGDERILHCLRRQFSGHELVVTSGFPDALERLSELNRCDCVLLGGGGLILRGFGRFAPLVLGLRVPFACVGISVEAIHADNVELVTAIKRKAEFVLVRDQSSARLLNHPKVVVGPDLTFLDPLRPASPVAEQICALNLRNWHYWSFEFGGAAHHHMLRLNRHLPLLRHIYPLPKWEPRRVLRWLGANFDVVRPVPFYLERGTGNDYSLMASLGVRPRELDGWRDPCTRPVTSECHANVLFELIWSSMASCRYLVAMRLHALIFACQMGIPFLSLSYQPKNREFCRAAGIESMSVELPDHRSLKAGTWTLKSRYDEIRSRILAYREQCAREINQIMGDLAGRIGGKAGAASEPHQGSARSAVDRPSRSAASGGLF